MWVGHVRPGDQTMSVSGEVVRGAIAGRTGGMRTVCSSVQGKRGSRGSQHLENLGTERWQCRQVISTRKVR